MIDDEGLYNLANIYNVVIVEPSYAYEYLLGILNSKFMVYAYQSIVPEKGKVFPQVNIANLNKLPIPKLDLANKTDKINHDKMVSFVESMLDAHKKLNLAQAPYEREMLQRKISTLDSQIDQLVYKLYDLTLDEIKIVEGK